MSTVPYSLSKPSRHEQPQFHHVRGSGPCHRTRSSPRPSHHCARDASTSASSIPVTHVVMVVVVVELVVHSSRGGRGGAGGRRVAAPTTLPVRCDDRCGGSGVTTEQLTRVLIHVPWCGNVSTRQPGVDRGVMSMGMVRIYHVLLLLNLVVVADRKRGRRPCGCS